MKRVSLRFWEPYLPLVVAVLVGALLADLSTLLLRPRMLPDAPPPKRAAPNRISISFKGAAEYSPISNNNIFHQGKIPPALSSGLDGANLEVAAVKSSLPMKLMGTIVHVDARKSLATIELRNVGEAKSFRVDEEIPGLARITKVERRKVTFINLQNKRREYIDIPLDYNISFNFKDAQVDGTTVQQGPVVQRGENDFSVARKDLDFFTRDLPTLLKEARMTPNLMPGGVVEGFRFVWIKPGSIFEKLGLKPGDVIRGVNGEDINDPKKAMEAYAALKETDGLVLNVIRNGREERIQYSITN